MGVAQVAWYVVPVSVTQLTVGDTTFHLVGTAHISQASIDEVEATIEDVRPDVVAVELDPARRDALMGENPFAKLDVGKSIAEGRTWYVLAHLALSAYQRRIGTKMGTKPGAELRAALTAAEARGIPVALIDRDIGITLKRTWANLGPLQRGMMVGALVVGLRGAEPASQAEIEQLKEKKALDDMLAELSKAMPEVKTPLIDERDAYLADKLLEAGAGKKRVVAVVGAAHVPGMTAGFGTPIDRAALEIIPPPSTIRRALRWVVPLAAVCALVVLGRHATTATWFAALGRWAAVTAGATVVGALIARGSLASILAAAAASPFAAAAAPSGLRSGMIGGLVELRMRPPRDDERVRLLDDIQTKRGFRSNRFTRPLLVSGLASLGTSIGHWIGVCWIAIVVC